MDDPETCPICRSTIESAALTKCGHSFCHPCIKIHLSSQSAKWSSQGNKRICPVCPQLLSLDEVYLNQPLDDIVRAKIADVDIDVLTPERASSLSVKQVDRMLAVLVQRKRSLLQGTESLDLEVCMEFLEQLTKNKKAEKAVIEQQIGTIDEDLQLLKERERGGPDADAEVPAKRFKSESGAAKLADSSRGGAGPADLSLRSSHFQEDAVLAQIGQINGKRQPEEAQARTGKLALRRQRMTSHYTDLEQAYFESHSRLGHEGNGRALGHFEKSLSRFTQFSRFNAFAQLNYGAVYHTSSIVSSIEFDRDQEYFATAGVTKEIKVYEYKAVVEQSSVDTHTPIMKMSCQSKISCLSWNPYFKRQICSSDYEGIVSLWDAYTGKRINKFEGHKKRTWSVDFAPTSPNMIASGSDDHHVKIWDINSEKAVATIESKANVCCVKFNPDSSNYIAFGSADHHIHYYDIRNIRDGGLFVFKGHAKAVSYVKFLNADQLVSASTDSTLKQWCTKDLQCKRTYTGHTNEKNFVGLSTSNDFIACGSENNAVYCYYKSLSKPVICHKFTKERTADTDDAEDTANFVSSVCWKKNSNVLLAANSLGTISIMDLV